MSDIGNVNNLYTVNIQSKEQKQQPRNITPLDSSAAVSPVMDDEQDAKVVSLSASSDEKDQQNEAKKDPLERAAEALQKIIPEGKLQPNTELKIDHDKEADRFVYMSVDKDSGEVVSQFPAKEILNMLAHFKELEGLAVDSSV